MTGKIRRLAWLAGGASLLGGLLLWQFYPAHPHLIVNATASLPIGIYRLVTAPLIPGAIVRLDAPMVIREYLAVSGDRPKMLLKVITAWAGDRLCIDHEAGIARIGEGDFPLKGKDSRGQMIPRVVWCGTIAAGQFAVTTPHPQSLDSRYFGPVSRDQIRGVYRPLWTPDFLQP